ncbi:hypothetical protein BpHYR1_033722, partial [Brachionus plicatilis]
YCRKVQDYRGNVNFRNEYGIPIYKNANKAYKDKQFKDIVEDLSMLEKMKKSGSTSTLRCIDPNNLTTFDKNFFN